MRRRKRKANRFRSSRDLGGSVADLGIHGESARCRILYARGGATRSQTAGTARWIRPHVGVTRMTPQSLMTPLSLRSEAWRENVSADEWLSTSIVHDLRNPLGTVYAAAEMLMELDPAPNQVKRLARNIFRAAGRMRELLADLNSVARGDRPMAEMCDIREIISAASDAASAI